MSRNEKLICRIFLAFVAMVAFGVFLAWQSMTWGERFLRPVQVGMSQSQVKSVVGPPPKIIHRTNATEAWYYDRWWCDAVVYFDTNAIVSAIEID